MSLSFAMWAMESFDGQNFAMCGKTIGSFRRNVLFWLKLMLKSRGYYVEDHRADNLVIVRRNGKENYFYIFGGKDERSQDLIQGITLAGVFFDEVALMPESFVNQATGRCSVDGSKYWFNCNPDGPYHWFKTDWIDKAEKKKIVYLHFTMNDNLSLSERIKKRYRSMYTGVFYKRYILGLWAVAEGIIYDMFSEEKHVISEPQSYVGRKYLKKIKEAVYGEEVRDSIHDAIEQCYKDATGHPDSVAATVKEIREVSANLSKETADRKAEVGIERKRIDNLVKDTTDNVVEYKADNFLMSCKSDAQASTAETTLNVFKNISSKSENLGNFITISSDSKIQIKKSGLYSFDCKVQVTGVNASTGRQYARLKINDVQKNEYMISLVGETDEEFTNFIVSLNEGDTISFTGEADFDDTWITLYTTIHILDYDGKVKIPDITKEVSDIRVGVDGTTYDTAGAAVRGQIKGLTDIIDLTFALSSSVLKSTTFSVKTSRKLAIIIPEGVIVYYYYRPGTAVAYKYSEGKIQRFNLNAGEQQHFEIRRESKDITSKTYLELMLIPRIL